MKFGLFHSVQLPNPSEQDRYYAEAMEQVLHAERLGYNSVWFTEHHFTRHGIVSATTSVLAYLAGVTNTIRLGTAVTVMPFHNPVQLAEQTATVDVLSNGRLDLGVGRGYQWGEFHRMNIPMDEASRRFEESMEILTRSWTSAEPFDHHGEFWSFNDLTVLPRPVQQPHPPVYVAASGADSVARVVRNDWNLLIGQGESHSPGGWAGSLLQGCSCRSGVQLYLGAGGSGAGHVYRRDNGTGEARGGSSIHVVQADRTGSERSARPPG